MCAGVLPVTFFAIALLLSPDILMTEIPDVPWAEACATMVPESLLTLLLKGFLVGYYSPPPPPVEAGAFVPSFLLILHCWAIDNNELLSQ